MLEQGDSQVYSFDGVKTCDESFMVFRTHVSLVCDLSEIKRRRRNVRGVQRDFVAQTWRDGERNSEPVDVGDLRDMGINL